MTAFLLELFLMGMVASILGHTAPSMGFGWILGWICALIRNWN